VFDDSNARRDWGWRHHYDLPKMCTTVINGIRRLQASSQGRAELPIDYDSEIKQALDLNRQPGEPGEQKEIIEQVGQQ
jgi:hypothetical protein